MDRPVPHFVKVGVGEPLHSSRPELIRESARIGVAATAAVQLVYALSDTLAAMARLRLSRYCALQDWVFAPKSFGCIIRARCDLRMIEIEEQRFPRFTRTCVSRDASKGGIASVCGRHLLPLKRC